MKTLTSIRQYWVRCKDREFNDLQKEEKQILRKLSSLSSALRECTERLDMVRQFQLDVIREKNDLLDKLVNTKEVSTMATPLVRSENYPHPF